MAETIKFEIPGIRGKTIEFSDSFVESTGYGGRRIYYRDVIGLSYYSISRYMNFVPMEQSFYIVIKDNNTDIDIKLTGSLYVGHKDNKKIFYEIIYIIEKIIKPFLFLNLLKELSGKGRVVVGKIELTNDGLSLDKFFGGTKCLSLNDYGFCKIEQGFVYIYKKLPLKDESYKLFSSIALREINAVILPEMLEYLKNEKTDRKGKGKGGAIGHFCPSCRKEFKKVVNFCPHCGLKIKDDLSKL